MAMDLKLSTNLKMSQKLVMTPMLQQAIKLLPLARLELAQQVRQEITENPSPGRNYRRGRVAR